MLVYTFVAFKHYAYFPFYTCIFCKLPTAGDCFTKFVSQFSHDSVHSIHTALLIKRLKNHQKSLQVLNIGLNIDIDLSKTNYIRGNE